MQAEQQKGSSFQIANPCRMNAMLRRSWDNSQLNQESGSSATHSSPCMPGYWYCSLYNLGNSQMKAVLQAVNSLWILCKSRKLEYRRNLIAVLTSSECGRSLEEPPCCRPVEVSSSKEQEALVGVSGRGPVGAGGGGVLDLRRGPNISSWWVMRNSTSAAWYLVSSRAITDWSVDTRGRNSVGPNTIPRLLGHILFSWFSETLWRQRADFSHLQWSQFDVKRGSCGKNQSRRLFSNAHVCRWAIMWCTVLWQYVGSFCSSSCSLWMMSFVSLVSAEGSLSLWCWMAFPTEMKSLYRSKVNRGSGSWRRK